MSFETQLNVINQIPRLFDAMMLFNLVFNLSSRIQDSVRQRRLNQQVREKNIRLLFFFFRLPEAMPKKRR